ncbi:Uncharacterised protein [Mycobacteroides abscessus]|nr:Uncharacterised protein [Mycobacteroides abscessus]
MSWDMMILSGSVGTSGSPGPVCRGAAPAGRRDDGTMPDRVPGHSGIWGHLATTTREMRGNLRCCT